MRQGIKRVAGLNISARFLVPASVCLCLAVSSEIALAQVGSLRVSTPSGPEVGTAFLVSADGYLATSFSLVQRATAGTLVLPNNITYRLTGWVTASKAHDVVILAVEKPPANLRPPTFAVQLSLQAGDVLGPTPGPLSQPLMQQLAILMPGMATNWLQRAPPAPGLPPNSAHFEFYAPKLRRVLSGAELIGGLPAPPVGAAGQGLDTHWLVLDVSFEPSYVGAPLWDNRLQRIHGMLAGPPGEDGRHRFGVQIQQVVELVPKGKVKPQPLSTLSKYEDLIRSSPSTLATAAPRGAERGLPLADRFTAHTARLLDLEKSIAELDQSAGKHKASAVAARARIDAIDGQLRVMRPEEAFTERFEVEIPASKGEKGEKGEKARTETRTRTSYRFSARQEAERKGLAEERNQHSASLLSGLVAENHARTFELPHTRRGLERTRAELFYFGDPLQLRSVADHHGLLASLDDQIGEGGAPGILFLVRGLCKLRLNRTAEAQADFKDAVDVDGQLRRLADVAEGRRLLLAGQSEKGLALINKNVNQPKRDSWIELLHARIQIDRGDFAAASRTLTAALQSGADPVETNLALAWINASAPAGEASNPRLALTSAQQACQLTGNGDWLSLAALAAANARANKFPEAIEYLKQAKELAPTIYVAQVDSWELALANKKPMELEWK